MAPQKTFQKFVLVRMNILNALKNEARSISVALLKTSKTMVCICNLVGRFRPAYQSYSNKI